MPTYHCKHGTCARLLNAPGYCHDHAASAERRLHRNERTARNPEAERFYNSRAWKATSATTRCANPLCQLCGQALATETHHEEPVIDAPESRLDPEKLLAVCHPCHVRVDAARRHHRRRDHPLVSELLVAS